MRHRSTAIQRLSRCHFRFQNNWWAALRREISIFAPSHGNDTKHMF